MATSKREEDEERGGGVVLWLGLVGGDLCRTIIF